MKVNCNNGILCFEYSHVKNLYFAGPEIEMIHVEDNERQVYFIHVVFSPNCAFK